MQTELATSRIAAYRLVGIQVVLTVALALLSAAFGGLTAAYSSLLGGMAYVVPNACAIWFAFKHAGSSTPRLILGRLYLGEAGKLLMTGFIFALCFIWVKPLHVGALFLTFIVMIIVNLAGLARIGLRHPE